MKVLRIKAQEEVADDSEKERKVLEQNEYDQNDKIAVLSMKVLKEILTIKANKSRTYLYRRRLRIVKQNT